MTAEEWARIKDIFEAALNVPEEERERYLESTCEQDAEIFQTVVELLRNHNKVIEASRRFRIETAPALKCGEVIAGRFRILRFIAAGGMGEVYEASDERLKVRLAIKTLRPAALAETRALERFQREIVIARSVSHQNVCRVFDLIEHRPALTDSGSRSPVIPCLAMELLEGETLAELIRRARPLSVDHAQPLIRQIAEGLQVLHEHGVIHRDLKPSNVMLARRKDGDVRAVVMDFGLAKKEDLEGALYDSHTDLQAGAPYFMAPELLRNGKPSVASDIYSLGLVIDELVTLTRAFSAASLEALYFAKLWEQPVDPASRANALPEHWRQAILRCVENNAEARFHSAREVICALESVNAPSMLYKTSLDAKSGGLVGRRLISRRAFILGGAAVPVVTGGVALFGMAFERVETSVEVFNIDNLTNGNQYDYFCQGITNELMRSLLHLDRVRVIPIYSTRANSPPKRLGRFSLDGLLEAESGQMRLSMRLTDNRDGTLVWAEHYDRQPVSSPIELESDIARGAVMALDQRILSNGESASSRGILAQFAMPLRRIFAIQSSAALPAPPTYSNAAFDLYMRGHSLLEEMSPASAERAAEYFLQAIQEDPSFALAYAGVSDARIASMNFDVTPRKETLASARSYAEEAVRRSPTLAEAHMVLGAVRQIDWDWSGAESSFGEALRLKPNLARARRWFAGLILQFRRFDEAVAETKRALDQDPYDRSGPPAFGLVLTLTRRFGEAEGVLLRSLASKDMEGTRLNLAQLYAWLGHISSGKKSAAYYANAFAQVNTVIAMEKGNSFDRDQVPLTDAMLALFHTMTGNDLAAEPYLERSEAAIDTGTLSPVMVAKVYSARRDYRRAIDLLDRAADWHDRRLMYANITPFFDNLHEQPGFHDLLNRMKL
jgi:serine/threonine protein kinase/tetratricopeptide (TPR) repeat protein